MTINRCFLLFLRYIAFDASRRSGLSSKGTFATQFDSLPRPKISASILILKYILSELTILLLLRNLFFSLSIDFSFSHVWISWTYRCAPTYSIFPSYCKPPAIVHDVGSMSGKFCFHLNLSLTTLVLTTYPLVSGS